MSMRMPNGTSCHAALPLQKRPGYLPEAEADRRSTVAPFKPRAWRLGLPLPGRHPPGASSPSSATTVAFAARTFSTSPRRTATSPPAGSAAGAGAGSRTVSFIRSPASRLRYLRSSIFRGTCHHSFGQCRPAGLGAGLSSLCAHRWRNSSLCRPCASGRSPGRPDALGPAGAGGNLRAHHGGAERGQEPRGEARQPNGAPALRRAGKGDAPLR